MRPVLLFILGVQLGAQTPGAPTMQDAIAKQRASIRKQVDAVHGSKDAPPHPFFAVPWPVVANAAETRDVALAKPADCDPISQAELQPMIARAAKREGIEANVLHRVMERESGFKPCAESPKGAMGLMQLMPGTATALAVPDPWNPQENIQGGARYLRMLLERYGGDLKLALSAYNAGPGRVDADGGVPHIAETQNYVNSIMSRLER